ncbi:ubiquitin carboxyl-terminal hydrolase MINDY-2 isoform X1 [Anabas testudineus]|uniref:Ubiquitin carboxyl-terminal hydrolase n=1 Tax=Anabas testudineus TaxID=64144 RepID=A0A3Q1HD84_ANATE|nr:ubiquitin carboxyl-terminal hydrolase MINDY-2 isoform X1 [Anabas testudineus]XP_026234292.1 ubiquitin carboxyl-terminal hydrolase MINDY-2 isoform X1 [Anabas testudineus]
MEKNANLHRDTDGSTVCATIAGEMVDVTAVGVVKGAAEKCKTSEAALSTLVNDSWNNSTADVRAPSDGSVLSTAGERGERQGTDVLRVQEDQKDAEASGSWSGDQISNGMGHDSVLAAEDSEGGASKLVNNQTDGSSSPPAEEGSTRVQPEVSSGADGDATKLAKPTHLCPDAAATVKSGLSATLSEGLPSGSDPDPSLGGESRSIDSLESFSNLNSCPSSDLNSEGLEDRGLALALQSEYGTDGTKTSCAKDRAAGQSIYHIKWIKWREENTPIITQNENGPCPLLAIMNVLLLAWKVKMPPMMEIITAEQLMEYLGDYILETKPKEISEAQRLNYEQNMSDAMAVLHKLQTGLDVNVKFTGVRVFEYTPECIVFDLLDIPLYHGWLVDPQMHDIVKAVGNCSYNQLVEKIISCKQSDNSELAGEGIVAEQFLSSTATQLTYHGLCELTSTVQEGELCVFFRNNHFSTMIKYKGQLYLLVTDQGFLTEEKVVWESLHNVDGDGNFCDSEFRLRPPSDPETVYRGQQDQIDQDYLMALSLQQEQQSQDLEWEQLPEGISDLELAKKLQEEEDRRASQYYQEQEQEQAAAAAVAQVGREQGQQEPGEGDEADRGAGAGRAAAGTGTAAAAAATPSPGKQSSSKSKKESKDKDKCVIL